MMPSGTEMMIGSLFKAMGFNPPDFVQKIEGFLVYVKAEMTKFTTSTGAINDRLSKIEKTQEEILTLLKQRELPLIITTDYNGDHDNERTDTGTGNHGFNGYGQADASAGYPPGDTTSGTDKPL